MANTTNRLPVIETVGKAFSYSARMSAVMIKLVWPWVPIILVAMILFLYALNSGGVGSPSAGGEGVVPPGFGVMAMGFVPLLVVQAAAFASIAVEWHRILLLGEKAGWFHLKLRSRGFAYLGYMLAITLVSLPPIALLMLVMSSVGALGQTESPPLAVLGVVTAGYLLIISRFFLVLPGAAVGDRRISLKRSFDLTKGNTLPIAGGFLLLTVISFGVLLVVALVETLTVALPIIGSIMSLLTLAVNLFLTFVGLSYMSFCYWFFVPSPESGDLA